MYLRYAGERVYSHVCNSYLAQREVVAICECMYMCVSGVRSVLYSPHNLYQV